MAAVRAGCRRRRSTGAVRGARRSGAGRGPGGRGACAPPSPTPIPAVRRRGAEEAGRLAAPATGAALVARRRDDDLLVIEAAAHALGELPPTAAAVDALVTLVTGHGEVVVRETAVAALGSLGDGSAWPVLAATTDVATVRRRAVLALAAFDGEEVEAALHRLRRGPRPPGEPGRRGPPVTAGAPPRQTTSAAP